MNKFAIIHMQKFQISDVQGIQKHNQRQGKSKSNLDIDYSKSEQNYDLLNQQKIRYESTIKQEISERVKRKPRANSVVLSEFVVTASPDYMHSLSLEEQKRYFESSLDFIQKRYGVPPAFRKKTTLRIFSIKRAVILRIKRLFYT